MQFYHHNINGYLSFYSLNTNQIQHQYEFLKINKEEIFFQTFTPTNPIATVFVVHGYLDHSGSLNHLINFLTQHQYQVMTYDLLGHGLSTGARASIDDFRDYVENFKEIYELKTGKATFPVHVIAHSTGGAVIMDYLLRFGNPFDKVILVSPLVRSYAWILSKIGTLLVRPFIKELRRVFKRNSSNRHYLQSVKKDPLQYRKLPLTWFQSLIAWNKQVKKYAKSETRIYVIQGNKDRTVDWKYNLKFLKKKFSQCNVQIIQGGDHQLFNERQQLLDKTFSSIEEILKNKK
jgi:alpha-beta hydrolase superfamily lysophospholipase